MVGASSGQGLYLQAVCQKMSGWSAVLSAKLKMGDVEWIQKKIWENGEAEVVCSFCLTVFICREALHLLDDKSLHGGMFEKNPAPYPPEKT